MKKTARFSCYLGRVLAAALILAAVWPPGPAWPQAEEVKIGVLAKRGMARALKKWSPTASYLLREIPDQSFMVIPYSFCDLRRAVARAEVDFVITNTGYYVELEHTHGVSRIATLRNLLGNRGYQTFGGVIFARADRDGLNTLQDLAGKSFMAVDQASFGGWWMAWRELADKGVDPRRDFTSLLFGGTHDMVVRSVAGGKVDAGTVRTDTLERMQAEGKIELSKFKVLHKMPQNRSFPFVRSTRLYPEWPFAKLKHTSDKLAQNVAVALFNMPVNSEAARAARIAGWTVPLDYQPVYELMKDLKLGPYKNFGKVSPGLFISRYWPWLYGGAALLLLLSLVTSYVIYLNRNLNQVRVKLSRELTKRGQAETKLRAAHDELEDRVSLRTSELEEANRLMATEIKARAKAQSDLKESEGKYRLLVETMSEGLCVIDREGNFTYANERFCLMLGLDEPAIVGKSYTEFMDEANAQRVRAEREKRNEGHSRPYEICWRKNDGSEIITLISPAVIWDDKGEVVGSFGVISDITQQRKDRKERERLAVQLRQNQKMEAIGTLAGGIAHDFNNILAAIVGYSELAYFKAEQGEISLDNLRSVLNAAERAKGLVAQILSFSRQSELEKAPVNLAPLAKEAAKFLRASLPSTIRIDCALPNDLGTVMADPTQMHQLVLNLCTNAKHAMAESGGVLSISLDKVVLTPEDAREYVDLKGGRYQRITVSDTGCGMDKKTMERILEPFFTTKPEGEGTGMGLSVVHGIVKSHGGAMRIYSEPGLGSTFRVYLPCLDSRVDDQALREMPLPRGSERVILVDDEADVVKAGSQMLEHLGYKVTGFKSSLEAWLAFQKSPGDFDLLITDCTMPDMTGFQLVDKVKRLRPDLPVIMCSGFNWQLNSDPAAVKNVQKTLTKPLTTRELGLAAREVLDKG